MLKSDRRHERRNDESDRRSFPRPPLWLTLALLLFGVAGLAFAHAHRQRVEKRFENVLTTRARTPADVNRMKNELAEMDLSREALEKELDGRMKFVESLKSENFYISVDTTEKKLRFYYGDTVLREAPAVIGQGGTFTSVDGKKKWTFVPVKGAFKVESKLVGLDWTVPEWLYAMNKQPAPASRPTVENGVGKYVITLPNAYLIHSPPPEGSPLKGPKPGSIMVAEEDLLAIWPRIHKEKTSVYIY
jgi:hypothetical protein